jgi:hypothetical protein
LFWILSAVARIFWRRNKFRQNRAFYFSFIQDNELFSALWDGNDRSNITLNLTFDIGALYQGQEKRGIGFTLFLSLEASGQIQ